MSISLPLELTIATPRIVWYVLVLVDDNDIETNKRLLNPSRSCATPPFTSLQVTVMGSVMAVCWAVDLLAQKAGLFEGYSNINPQHRR